MVASGNLRPPEVAIAGIGGGGMSIIRAYATLVIAPLIADHPSDVVGVTESDYDRFFEVAHLAVFEGEQL